VKAEGACARLLSREDEENGYEDSKADEDIYKHGINGFFVP